MKCDIEATLCFYYVNSFDYIIYIYILALLIQESNLYLLCIK